jgi:hypothetical protein
VLIDVLPLVREVLPGLLRHPRPSVACVRTTHQKYLVFDGDASRPACVVEIGDETRLRRIHSVLSALHPLCPREVPRSLACVACGPGEVVHIQEGLSGVPWFRLFESLTTPRAWNALLDRAIDAMSRLHGATAAVPSWAGSVDLADALAHQARIFRPDKESPLLDDAIARSVARLCGVEPIPAVAQHGDFSLNNLMVAADGIAVIDFEEFDLTRVPLHDAIGLGLSFSMSQDDRCPISVRDCVERCIGGAEAIDAIDADVLRALLLHHLVWRINQGRGKSARTWLRGTLIKIAEAVAVAPGNGLAGLAAA